MFKDLKIGDKDIAVHQDLDTTLSSTMLEDARLYHTRVHPKFLDIYIKETWTSVSTVPLTYTVYVTVPSTTVLTTLIQTITSFEPVAAPYNSYFTADNSIFECGIF